MGLYKMKLVGDVDIQEYQKRIIELLTQVGAGKIEITDYVLDWNRKQRTENNGVKIAFAIKTSKVSRGIAVLENGQLWGDNWGVNKEFKSLQGVVEQAVYAAITEKTVKKQGYLTTKITCASDFESYNEEEGLYKLTAYSR